MVRNLHAAFARIWTFDEEEDVLELRASAGMYTHLDGPHSRVPVGSLKIGLIARERLPRLTNDVLDDPRVSDKEWARREGIERKRAEEALRGVREAERNRIARDLHDDILQDIVYALQEIQILQVTSHDGAGSGLEEAAEALRRSVEGLRGAIFELRLRETLGLSFVASLEALMNLNRRRARRSCELELIVEDGFPVMLLEKASSELVRIVQEALANARRHAGAGHIRVRLWHEGDLACVEVADDGRGFDTGVAGTGVGQHSMRHRALEIGGELKVESAPGRGTRVRFEGPVSRLVAGS
jgi:signal transduction histidine kinase